MKLLIVSSAYYPHIRGGAEHFVQTLAEGLAAVGIDTHVLTLGLKDQEEVINGVKVSRRYLQGRSEAILQKRRLLWIDKLVYRNLLFWDLGMYRFYYREIKQLSPDVVHVANPMYNCATPMCCRAARTAGVPVLVSIHDFAYLVQGRHYPLKSTVARSLYKRAFLKSGATLHFISDFMHDHFDQYGYDMFPRRKIYNAVDVDKISATAFRKKKSQVVYAGRLTRSKGLDDLAALSRRFKDDPECDVEFLYVGDGAMRSELPPNANCTGWVSHTDSMRHIGESKVLVLPALAEPFGLVLLEALACGTLCVARNAGACPEVLGNRDEYLFADVDDLFRKVKRILMLSEEAYSSELAEARTVLERYTVNKQIHDFVACYEDLIRGGL